MARMRTDEDIEAEHNQTEALVDRLTSESAELREAVRTLRDAVTYALGDGLLAPKKAIERLVDALGKTERYVTGGKQWAPSRKS